MRHHLPCSKLKQMHFVTLSRELQPSPSCKHRRCWSWKRESRRRGKEWRFSKSHHSGPQTYNPHCPRDPIRRPSKVRNGYFNNKWLKLNILVFKLRSKQSEKLLKKNCEGSFKNSLMGGTMGKMQMLLKLSVKLNKCRVQFIWSHTKIIIFLSTCFAVKEIKSKRTPWVVCVFQASMELCAFHSSAFCSFKWHRCSLTSVYSQYSS